MNTSYFAEFSIIQELKQSHFELNEDLSNIDVLSEKEWETLIKYFLTYVTAGSIPAITLGVCFLKYIHDLSPLRFNTSIIKNINDEEHIDLGDSWD